MEASLVRRRCPVQGLSCAHARARVCLHAEHVPTCAQTPDAALPPTGIEVAAVTCVASHLQLAPSIQRVAGNLG